MATSTTYDDFVANVRSWANRDTDVLPDAIIQDALSYTADKAYRLLKIPAFEANIEYTIIDTGVVATSSSQVYLESTSTHGNSVVKLPIPADLTSFIHLRIKSSSSKSNEGVVFNEKTDVRTFWDMYSDRYTDFVWARQTNFMLASGQLSVGDVIELHYYRRLPALNARYNVTAANFNEGLVEVATIQPGVGTTLYFDSGTSYPPTPFTDTAYSVQNVAGDREEFKFNVNAGVELDNWLRDENRQILLFGSLQHVFDYLDDSVQSQKYQAKFIEAINELNQEEKLRKSSGGNIQVHFNSVLI
jgi:hypothetical protein